LLEVPLISIVIGEGASGGAIGIGMGNELYMMENTWYSVIAPESCSTILWKNRDFKEQAASELKLTAPDLKGLGIIDGLIQEPPGGAHRDAEVSAKALKQQLIESLQRLQKMDSEKLVRQRINQYSAMGEWKEESGTPASKETQPS